MGLEYEGLDMSEVGLEATRVNTDPEERGTNAAKYVQLPQKDGYITMRFLPRLRGQKLYCATRTHRLAERSYHCPRVLTTTPNGQFWLASEEHGDCIVCKYCRQIWQKSMKLEGAAQKELQDLYRKIKPVERYYYNVIVRKVFNPKTNETEKNVGPLIYSCGKTVHSKIMTAIIGDVKAGKKPKGDITDPKSGRDFRLVKKTAVGAGGMTYPSYDESEFEEQSPAGTPEELERWLANLHDLQSLRVLKDEATLKRALQIHLGVITDDEEDWSEFEVPQGAAAAAVLGEEEPPQQPSKPIAKQEKKPAPKAKAVEDEILADPDFMKELEGMEA